MTEPADFDEIFTARSGASPRPDREEEPVHEDRLVLSRKQERRLIACKQAREILGSRGFSSSGAVSASEVTNLAGYIITGETE